jgi:ABC-2 type transport system permease protein
MPRVLELISDALPLSYATDAFTELSTADGFSGTMTRDLVVLLGFVIVSVALASLTLRRRTP